MEYIGGHIDNRIENKDYSFLEVGKTSEPTYLTKKEAKKVEKLYPKRNQKSTSSCGGHAGELALSIDTGKLHEQAFIYRNRTNYPSEGMFHYDIGDILFKKGACEYLGIEKTESTYNSFTPTESQNKEALAYSETGFIVLQDGTFTMDDIAYISNDLKRPLIIFTYWKKGEWSSDKPRAIGDCVPHTADACHYVTVLPNGVYKDKGVPYAIIQDSITNGGVQIRHLSKDWIDTRVYTALYRQAFRYREETKPDLYKGYIFLRNLKYGDKGEDVKTLQLVLQQYGFFPVNIQATENFRGITRQAVKDFQEANRSFILKPLGLDKPTGIFGDSTRKRLNMLLR